MGLPLFIRHGINSFKKKYPDAEYASAHEIFLETPGDYTTDEIWDALSEANLGTTRILGKILFKIS